MVLGRSEGAVPNPPGNTGAPRPPADVDGEGTAPWRAVSAAPARPPRGLARRLRRSPTHWAVPLLALCAAGLTWALDESGLAGVHRVLDDDGAETLAEGGPGSTTTEPPARVPDAAAPPAEPVAGDATAATEVPPDGTDAGSPPAPAPATATPARGSASGRTATPSTRAPASATPPTSAAPTTPPPPPPPRPAVSGTFVGDLISTLDGPVQVSAVVSNGRLVDVQFVRYPDDTTQRRAYSYLSLPVLRDRSVAAQSWDVDTVSQATYTSKAYKASLRAALGRVG
jgi:uncharacterized protein with FMN-binding domain